MISVFAGCRDATQLHTPSATSDCKTGFLDSPYVYLFIYFVNYNYNEMFVGVWSQGSFYQFSFFHGQQYLMWLGDSV